MIASEKAALSLICSVAGGVLNMVLDYVLIAVFDMGISGVAAVTIIMYVLMAERQAERTLIPLFTNSPA